MLRYALHRLFVAIPMLLGLSVVLFFYIHAIPGDPIAAMLGSNGNPQLIAKIRAERGLDAPLIAQYWNWLSGLFHGSLGVTLRSGKPITPILIHRIPATLQLMFVSLLFTLLLGIPAGFLAGMRKGSWWDRILTPIALLGLSMPVFWIGTLLILIVGVNFGWLPTGGYVPFMESPLESLQRTLLPGLTLGLQLAPFLARLTRTSTGELQQEPFVTFASIRGLRSRTITGRYLARNTVLPILIVLGMLLAKLLGGQVIVEQLFNWPGVGRLLVTGAIQRDYPMVQALILILAAIYIAVNLGVELLHAWLDPRVRL